MADSSTQVEIRILDKEYLVACRPEEREELFESARLLDAKMRQIRDSGKVVGAERIAVMAALNLAHELVGQGERDSDYNQDMKTRLRMLQEKIDAALDQDRQMLL